MKKSFGTFITGVITGSIITSLGVIIGYKIIDNHLTAEEEKDLQRRNNCISKMSTILAGTESEVMTETYTDIINNINEMFPDTHEKILNRFEDILNEEDHDKCIKDLEVFLSSLGAMGILHDQCVKEDTNEDPDSVIDVTDTVQDIE